MTREISIKMKLYEGLTDEQVSQINNLLLIDPILNSDGSGEIVMLTFAKNGFYYNHEIAEYLKNVPESERQKLLLSSRINNKRQELEKLEKELGNMK